MSKTLRSIISQNESLIENNQYYISLIVGIFVFMHTFLYFFFLIPLVSFITLFPVGAVGFWDNLFVYDFLSQILVLIFLYYILDSFLFRIKNPKFQLNSNKILLANYVSGIIGVILAIILFSIIYSVPINLFSRDIVLSFTKPLEEVLVVLILQNKYFS